MRIADRPKGTKIVETREDTVAALWATLYGDRAASDAKLVEVGNFRKYEDGLLRRRGDFGRSRGFSRGAPVNPKPPPPKAPIEYWGDQQLGSESEKGKGESSK